MRKLVFRTRRGACRDHGGTGASPRICRSRRRRRSRSGSTGPAVISAAISGAALPTRTSPTRCNWCRIRPWAPARHAGITTVSPVAKRRRDRRADRLRLPVRSLLGGRHRRRGLGLDDEGLQDRRASARQSRHGAGAGQDRFPDQRDRTGRLRVRQRAALRQRRLLPWRADRYDVTGSFAGHARSALRGWKTASAGLRAAAWNGRSRNIGPPTSNTTIMDLGTAPLRCPMSTNVFLGNVDVRQNIQVVKVGLNFHIWGAGL